MKILIFIYSLGKGGAERVAANLSELWINNKWDVTIVSLAPQADCFYTPNPAVHQVYLDMTGESMSMLHGLTSNLRRIRNLRSTLRQLRPDAIIAMMSTAGILAIPAAVGLRIPVIVAERTNPAYRRLSRIWEALRAALYPFADTIVALTDRNSKWLRQHTHSRNVVVIPNAVNWPTPGHSPYLEAAALIGAERRILLSAGRLSHEKGFDLLLGAFAGIAPQHPTWDLVILGDGPERTWLEMRIRELDLSKRVFLPGWIGNVGDWYARADLYVLSSRVEGFPNALIEAMAYGCPAVSFDCDTGPQEIIRHEVDGLLVPPENPAALSAALSRLISDAQLRRRFRNRATEVRERFSEERIGAMWEELIADLVR